MLLSVIAIAGRDDLVDEHADLARLLEAGDIDGALAALERHFNVTRRLVQAPGSAADGRAQRRLARPTIGRTEQPKVRSGPATGIPAPTPIHRP